MMETTEATTSEGAAGSGAGAPRFVETPNHAYIPAHPDPTHPGIMLAGEWAHDAAELADFRDATLAVLTLPHPRSDLAACGGRVLPLPEGSPTWADMLHTQERVAELERRVDHIHGALKRVGVLLSVMGSELEPSLREVHDAGATTDGE